MTLTDNVKFRLEQLINHIILTKDGKILVIKGYETREKKSLFGTRTVVTRIKVIGSRHIDTTFCGVYEDYLPERLDRLEQSRIRFKLMQSELEKFGYVIKGKQG